jgi:hypothetical protein
MNRIFILNGLLLATCAGLQQFNICNHDSLDSATGLLVASPIARDEAIYIYIGASLIAPLAVLSKSNGKRGLLIREFAALLVFNPIVFFLFGQCHEQLKHEWTLSELAGPRTVILVGPGYGYGHYNGVLADHSSPGR